MYHDKKTDPRPRHQNKGNTPLRKIPAIYTHSIVGYSGAPSLEVLPNNNAKTADFAVMLFLLTMIILIYLLFKPTPKGSVFIFRHPPILPI